jgi:hypothetical protein
MFFLIIMHNEELKGITYETGFYLSDNAYHCKKNLLSLWSSTFCKWRAAPEPSASRMRLVSRVVVTPVIVSQLVAKLQPNSNVSINCSKTLQY